LRYEVEVKTTGGHSWSDFGNDNAIAVAARIIAELYSVRVPTAPQTTYNVGMINGGISVNTIAGYAAFLIDLRSEDTAQLAWLDRTFLSITERHSGRDIVISCKQIGERPVGRNSEPCALKSRIFAIRKIYGMDTVFEPLSTDANIPLSLGIPSVAFGIYRGGGAHTLGEYIELDSMTVGLSILLHTMIEV
jgi:acetylornithine deacetylase/succinyl-diaminopimelate desuccinylase-like protein